MELYIRDGLLIILFISLVTQLVYLLAYQRKVSAYRAPQPAAPDIPISVIISARNEAANLTAFLPAILEQNYPQFEVVVVNDCSFDNSVYILEDLQKQYSHLKVVTVSEHPRYKTGKKFAITMGIKAAAHEHLLFTDADCQPVSTNWILRMAENFSSPDVQIVLGYSPYTRKGGLLNAIIRFETIKTAINYFSAALRGRAYMGVGRNLAYTRSLFFANKGFASHMHVLSGDDDLFVNQNATPVNTAIELNPDSFVFSEPKTTFSSWMRQKKRHMGAGKLYKPAHKRFLTIEALSGIFFYLALLAIIYLGYSPELLMALGLFLLRWVIQLIVYKNAFTTFKGKDMLWYLPIIDLVYYLYLLVFGLVGTFIKTTKWK